MLTSAASSLLIGPFARSGFDQLTRLSIRASAERLATSTDQFIVNLQKGSSEIQSTYDAFCVSFVQIRRLLHTSTVQQLTSLLCD
jgi:hypothetical protein